MPGSYIISGTTSPSTNGTTEVVLEKDDQGQPTKVISTTQACELSESEKEQVEALGVVVKKVSDEEVAELVEEDKGQQAGSDAASAGPRLGSSASSPSGSGSGSESTKK